MLVIDQVTSCLFYLACKVHGIVYLGDQSKMTESYTP